MDQSETGVGLNESSTADGMNNTTTTSVDTTTTENTSEGLETPQPSDGCNAETSNKSVNKPSIFNQVQSEGLSRVASESDDPCTSTSNAPQSTENSLEEIASTVVVEGVVPVYISTPSTSLITDSVGSLNDVIVAQPEATHSLGNDVPAVVDNMEIETNEASDNEHNLVPPELEHNHNDDDEDALRFDPSPLIEPLLEDDDMVDPRIDDEDVDPPIGDNEGDDNLMLEDISDDASSSSDAVFDDDQMRAAFREMLVQNRRGGENFMQRLRSAFFTMEHNRERRRTEPERNEVEIEEPEPEPENPISFDTNLPAEHSYLGDNMNRVSGVHYLEAGQQYNMMLFQHQHILFPGEILPFMISGSVIESDMDAQNGLLFGVCFPVLYNSDYSEKYDTFYGVTCQIYEKGTDERGNTLIKSRALQRFVTNLSQVSGPLQSIAANPQLKVYGMVRILPEIFLREPLKCIDMGSLNRFRDIESMRDTYKRYQATSTVWPAHVYNYYSITAIVEKARSQLAQHKIDTMPTDPTQLSFWLVRNLHLPESLMKTIFLTDSVNIRMKLISNTFTDNTVFTCRYCGNRIANCEQLFAMSKHGVQTQYCNSAGYIHETNTVYQLLPDAITYSGQPSAEFSWFPGYEWHIIVCKICSRHIGWKFKALEPNLVPKSFFGISSSSVRISSPSPGSTNTHAAFFQSLMRLARREMQ